LNEEGAVEEITEQALEKIKTIYKSMADKTYRGLLCAYRDYNEVDYNALMSKVSADFS